LISQTDGIVLPPSIPAARRRGAEAADQLSRLRDDLRQAKQRADRAEQWLTVIHQQIEGRLLPSLNRDSSHRKDQKMKDNGSSTGK